MSWSVTSSWSFLVFFFVSLPPTSCRIGPDGLCAVYVFVPFTVNGTEAGPVLDYSFSPGISQMSTALLAMDHFNARNPAIVPELANLGDCKIQFDLNRSLVFDTGAITHMASRSLAAQDANPCAIAGPFHNVPALDLSTMAQAAEYPLVAHRASNLRVVSTESSPFSLQTFPDMFAHAEKTVEFLLDKGRHNYIALAYALTDTGSQRRESLGFVFDEAGMDWISESYLVEGQEIEVTETRTPLAALQRIKDSGYRTIVVAMEFPLVELPLIAKAAEELDINEGDHMWVWFGDFEPFAVSNDTMIRKVVDGSGWITPFTGAEEHIFNDTYVQAWKSQGADFAKRVNEANPIKNVSEPGYFFVNDTLFQQDDSVPDYGSSFLYDAVMCIGFGACAAEQEEDGSVNGYAHYDAIRATEFTGASGNVTFRQGDRLESSRFAGSVSFGVFNFFPTENETLDLTDIFPPGATEWQEIRSFTYRDGRNVPPNLLRATPEQNYLSSGLRIFGFTLMAIAWLFALVTFAWVYKHRNHRVIRAAQPTFLYLLAVGAAVEAASIFSISFDESYGWNESELSSLCMSLPWLLSLGHTITFSTLFTKLWRVNKVLQFSRRRVKVRHVALPMVVLVVFALVILSVWTALDPLRWNRKTIDNVTGESIGECTSDHMGAYVAPLFAVGFIPAVLTAVFAWKTKDVDDAYAESWWIFALIVVQLEVLFIAVPVVVILRDVSADGRYVGLTFIQWTFPMSTLSLIIIPKMLAYYRSKRAGSRSSSRRKRGEQPANGVYVSGISRSSGTPAGSSNTEDPLQLLAENTDGSNVLKSSIPEEDENGSQEELLDDGVKEDVPDETIKSQETSPQTSSLSVPQADGAAASEGKRNDELPQDVRGVSPTSQV